MEMEEENILATKFVVEMQEEGEIEISEYERQTVPQTLSQELIVVNGFLNFFLNSKKKTLGEPTGAAEFSFEEPNIEFVDD